MPSRAVVALALLAWTGLVLLLAEVPALRRAPLARRLRPYAQGRSARRTPQPFSTATVADVIGPIARALGAGVARGFGVGESAALRLERIHSPLDLTAFRVRQLGWAIGGSAVGALLAWQSVGAPALALLLLLAPPLVALLAVEQQLATASARWQRRVFLELPIVEEQLAILLSAGYSLGAALNRIAARGRGACAADLRRVCLHLRQGRSDEGALADWANVAAQEGVTRLVAILGLDREASDLGRLVSDEARAVRREVHRELLAAVERKGQQVWVPVTLATLIPGIIFVAVPFVSALRVFTN